MPSSLASWHSGTMVIPTTPPPRTRNIALSALVENLGPSTQTYAPPTWYGMPSSPAAPAKIPLRYGQVGSGMAVWIAWSMK